VGETGPDYDVTDTLVISDPAQMRAVADETRHRVLALLRDRAASVTDLAQVLGMPKGTLAHHMKVLETAGLVRVVRTRQVRALTEKFYGRVARLYLIEHDGEDPRLVQDIAAATLRTAASEVGSGGDGSAYHGLVRARLTKADAERFERRLKKLVHDFRAAETSSGTVYGLVAALYEQEQEDA
jgi:DNA-binding transcriptional ArsR family regulator